MSSQDPGNTEIEYRDVVIPLSWEQTSKPMQFDLVGPEDISQLSDHDRATLCQSLFGDLRRAYRGIIEQAKRVRERVTADRLQGDSAVMSRPHAGDAETARAMAIAAVTDWFYRDGQSEKETSVYMGAIACSRETLGAIQELNRCKDVFSDVMDRIKDVMDDEEGKGEINSIYAALVPDAPLNMRRKEVGAMVRQCIHKRLNIRQLVRHVPLVPVCPDRIRWKWTQTPSTIRVTKEALIEVLESRQEIEARYDLEAVAQCSDPEFSWQKGVSEDCRIGVFCKSAVEAEGIEWDRKNLSFKGRMPLFYLAPRLASYIEKPKARKNLSAKRIKPQLVMAEEDLTVHERRGKTEKQSFLQSMAVRRYLHYVENRQASGS
ncbi:hypothetical protein AWH63_10430 [Marinobacter sp. C18]|uniref:hypothetical protein n=1 Tax=Marinobacter sp. C18 TaxID=1772288 RepID=UPI000948A590|nr:hypothetical protein [Marinobacter sp. C18]OLF81947.1 hypothetical protein AWH63_10430 [Marinobacter sp. C18]